MTGRGRALLHHTALLARDAWTALRGALGRVSFGTWAGVAGGLAASGWLLALPGGPPTGTALLVPFTSVEGMARLGGAALAGAWAILLLHTGTVAVDPSARGGRGRDLLRLLVGCVVVAAVLLVLSDGAGAAVVTGQEAPPAPAPVSTAPDLKAVLDNARNWLMGILATIATFF
ncbi:hypothetical protein, partial [Parafrankia elaeagni]|uniref:hypothetical protein n=1 Tax=Parafrankia elaeagni TaxID=222534 RepID=UPI00037D9888